MAAQVDNQQRALPPHARRGPVRISRREIHKSLHERHAAADYGAAGPAHYGRGHNHAVQFRGDDTLDMVERAQAGIRRHRPRNGQHRPGEGRGGHHAAHLGHHAGARLRQPVRHGTHTHHCRPVRTEGHIRRGTRFRRARQAAGRYSKPATSAPSASTPPRPTTPSKAVRSSATRPR